MSGDSCLPQHHIQSDRASPPPPLACPKTKTCSYRGAVGLGNKYVRLNVGGNLFYTTLQVLTRQNSMLKAMFSGKKEVFTDKEGWILIDRSGKHFGSILCYLRDGTVALPKGRQAVQELLAEAKYYLIQGLVELCQTSLQAIAATRFAAPSVRDKCQRACIILTGSQERPPGCRGLHILRFPGGQIARQRDTELKA